MSPSFPASSSKTRMNSSPIRRRFSSGSSTPSSRARKRSSRLDVDERHVEVAAEGLDHLLGLVRAHEAVVDEDAGELVADRLVDEQRGDGRVDAAREPADDALAARPARGSARPAPRSRRPASTPAARRRCRRGSSSAGPGRAACARPRGGTGRRRACARASSNAATGVDGDVAVRPRLPAARRPCRGGSSRRPAARAALRTARRVPPSSSVLPNSEAPVRSTSPPSSSAISWAP